MSDDAHHVVIEENLRDVRSRIAEAALRTGREPNDVTLVAVSKTFPATAVLEAWEAGQRHFGENRPREGLRKLSDVAAALGTDPATPADQRPIWHMIGHVQSRKTDLVAAHFDTVHSMDRMKFARKLGALMAESGDQMPVLMECNVSGEASKYGYDAAGWDEDTEVRDRICAEVTKLLALDGLRLEGLMTMAPMVDDPEEIRWVFASLRGLRDLLAERFPEASWHHLSMGMTDDFEVAVAEGATLVRVGRAIFGPRSW